MRTPALLICCLAIVSGCKKAGQPGATPPGSTSAAYPMCSGQKLPPGTPPPRSGPVTLQLAPAFLDQMNACRPEHGLPKDVIARAGDGIIDAKGDCQYASVGVSCHYHTGSEFVTTSTSQQTPGRGELHCIFPSSDPKSPSVYGGHVVCREAGQGAPAGDGAHHEVHEGARCPAGLLAQLTSYPSFQCCDDGTLTPPIADLVRDGRNDIRPGFRISTDPIVIDCSLLANLTGHAANSPALGGIGEPVFPRPREGH
jgi:hypothetical protein